MDGNPLELLNTFVKMPKGEEKKKKKKPVTLPEGNISSPAYLFAAFR